MNREAILGIVLVVIISGVFLPKLFDGNEVKSGAANSVQFEDKNNQLNAIKAQFKTEDINLIGYNKNMQETNSWNYGARQEFVDKTTTEVVFTVQAILGENAIINDNICSVGDILLNHIVSKIDAVNQTVTLEGPDSERIISVTE